MRDWLQRLGGGASLENRAALSRETLELLTRDLSGLKGAQRGRALRYVVDGDDGEILLALAADPKAGARLGLKASARVGYLAALRALDGHSKRRERLARIHSDDPGVWARLAEVYEAASRGAKRMLYFESLLGQHVWLELLLMESMAAAYYVWPADFETPFSAQAIEGILAAAGAPPDLLVRCALLPEDASHALSSHEAFFTAPAGFDAALARHPGAVIESLRGGNARQRAEALGLLGRQRVPVDPILEPLVDLGVSGSKPVREAAEGILRRAAGQVLPAVEERLTSGPAAERKHAVRLYAKLAGEAGRPRLEAALETEKVKSVREAIGDCLAAPAHGVEENAAFRFELPELPPVETNAPLPDSVERLFRSFVDEMVRALEAYAKQHKHRRYLLGGGLSGRDIGRAWELLQHGDAEALEKLATRAWFWQMSDFQKRVRPLLEAPELETVHLVRLLVLLGTISKQHYHGLGYHAVPLLSIYRKARSGRPHLRELAHAAAAIGLDARGFGRDLLGSYWWNPYGYEIEELWPYFAEHFPLVEAVFDPGLRGPATLEIRWAEHECRRHAYRLLAGFPALPPATLERLWEVALGPSKLERPLAQACLEDASDRVERCVRGLASGKFEARAAAASWLARRCDADAREAVEQALHRALAKERQEFAKNAMLEALEAFGASTEAYLSREALLEEARAGLEGGIPKALAWFPFDALPPVHWADTGGRVAPEVFSWLLVRGVKLKTPEPGPILRRHLAAMRADEVERLGQFVLDAWIAHDTRPAYTKEQARAEARRQAPSYQQWDKRPLERIEAEIATALLRECKGSAIGEKGVLQLTAASGYRGAAASVRRYLDEWYGYRAAQCKVLVQVLAWIDDPVATQQLLSVATRFRTKGIQQEAQSAVTALAERRGWSVDELADRTAPAAGLDERGCLALDYGGRVLEARLDETLALRIYTDEGKPLKSLPAARSGDDPELVAAAKKELSRSRKALKEALKRQSERLYEAMCTGRSWPLDDWQRFLLAHPIVGRLCQRVLWQAREGERKLAFRPLEDLSLVGDDDAPVALGADAVVSIAHTSTLDASEAAAWRRHWDDYGVAPLFEQLREQAFSLAEDQREETEIVDFRGHMLDALALRSAATSLGWVRGEAEDGGWFCTYRKDFTGLGLRALIEFSGSSLPEESRRVALTGLAFERLRPPGDGPEWPGPARIQLGEVPAVLLGECHNDLAGIAAKGTGYDASWEKHVEY